MKISRINVTKKFIDWSKSPVCSSIFYKLDGFSISSHIPGLIPFERHEFLTINREHIRRFYSSAMDINFNVVPRDEINYLTGML